MAFVAAVILAAVPTLAFLSRSLVWVDSDILFLLSPVAAALALALGLSGTFLLRATRLPIGIFVVADVLLGLNLAAVALSSYAWFTISSCGGGYSGPCFTPFILCGGGLLLDIVAAILVTIGIVLLRRPPRGPYVAPLYAVPPSWPRP